MKKLLLISALFVFACDNESSEEPCIYEPTLETNAVSDITESSVTLNGVISIVLENCEAPNDTEQGFVYSTEIQPTLEDVQVNVSGTSISATIVGLTPNTTYYVRSFLANNFGEFYGNEVYFTTNEEIFGLYNCNGNPVSTIVYGTQEWTTENACHTTYRDGTPIPQVTDPTDWNGLSTGAWCYYNNDPTKPRLYNWYAVMGIHDTDPNTPNKEFAPEGWHVPSDAEWSTLENYLITNGYNYDGTTTENKIAKAMASTHGWNSSTSTGAVGNDLSLNNSSGFNAFPQGSRFSGGAFLDLGNVAYFWSSTTSGSSSARSRNLYYYESNVFRGDYSNLDGFSVRLVRD